MNENDDRSPTPAEDAETIFNRGLNYISGKGVGVGSLMSG